MPSVTLKTLTNAGDPIATPDGKALANTLITIQLVSLTTHKPMAAFDAVTGELISSDPVEVTTDINGEFTASLWPNDRGDHRTCYKVTVDSDAIKPFFVIIQQTAGDTLLIAKNLYDAGEGGTSVTLIAGPSAYEVAVLAGYVGTEAQWLSSLIGGKGDQGDQGNTGVAGNGILSTVRTSGTGAAGTTDIYTITFTDTTTTTFEVYNGLNGTGTGDMLKSVYDTTNNGKVDAAELSDTATKLATIRKINGVNFDGTADITIPAVDTATPREPAITAGTSAQYLRGDKTLATFATAALAAAPAETVTTTGALVLGATDKPTPVDADYVGLMDSAASNVLKKLSWSNIKATLKTYFDTLYSVKAGSSSLITTGAVTGTSFNSITGLSATTPAVNGTAAVGTGTTAARGDHVHPTDTGRAASTHSHAESDVTGLATDLAAKAALATAQSFTKAQRGAVASLTSTSASVAVDLSLANHFKHALTESTTLAAPSNAVEGQSGTIEFTQNASTAKTLAYNTFWKFIGGTVPSLTTTLSAKDTFVYTVAPGGTYATCRLLGDIK